MLITSDIPFSAIFLGRVSDGGHWLGQCRECYNYGRHGLAKLLEKKILPTVCHSAKEYAI